MTGWIICRDPNGVRLYFTATEIKVEVFLDYLTSLRLRDAISHANRAYWKVEKKKRRLGKKSQE